MQFWQGNSKCQLTNWKHNTVDAVNYSENADIKRVPRCQMIFLRKAFEIWSGNNSAGPENHEKLQHYWIGHSQLKQAITKTIIANFPLQLFNVTSGEFPCFHPMDILHYNAPIKGWGAVMIPIRWVSKCDDWTLDI